MNPFDKGQQQLGDRHPRPLRMSGDRISQWSQWCIDGDVVRRPAGPYGSTEYARPFEDKPEDIVNLALDALDEKKGRGAPPKPMMPPERAATARLRRPDGRGMAGAP